MPKNGSRRGATNLGTPLMIAAFVVIGGFLYWLSAQAAAERAEREVEEVPADDATSGGVETVSVDDVEMDATPFVGQEIRIANTDVASLLGEQGFWLQTTRGNPFLISMGPEVMASGASVSPGSAVTVRGTVHEMGDSVLTAWTEAGTIGEGDRIVAEFATHYVEATEVVTTGGGAAQGARGGSGN